MRDDRGRDGARQGGFDPNEIGIFIFGSANLQAPEIAGQPEAQARCDARQQVAPLNGPTAQNGERLALGERLRESIDERPRRIVLEPWIGDQKDPIRSPRGQLAQAADGLRRRAGRRRRVPPALA